MKIEQKIKSLSKQNCDFDLSDFKKSGNFDVDVRNLTNTN